MNPTRWAFLYHGMQRQAVQAMEIQQMTLSRALGLSAIPVRDKATGKLRMPAQFNEVTPLLYATAQPAYMAHMLKLWEELEKQETNVDPDDGDCPPVDLLDQDTGIEILDRPIESIIQTEAERRQLGIQPPPVVGRSKKFSLDE